MRLQSKVLMIVGGIWIIVCSAIYIESKTTLENDYTILENRLTELNLLRVQNAITNQFSTLALYTKSFSQWDDAYQFMHDKNKHFIETNFVAGTFTSSNINFLMYFDKAGKLFYGKAYDLTNQQLMPISDDLLTYFDKHKNFVTHAVPQSQHVGFISTLQGYLVMTSLPVLTSEGNGPPAGSLLIGYYLNDNFFNSIANILKLNIQFIPMTVASITNDNLIADAYKQLRTDKRTYIVNAEEITYGFTLLKDIDGNPIGILKVAMNRVFYQESMTMINHYLTTIILLGIVISFLLWFLLKYIVLDRILSVDDQVTHIFTDNKFNKRIHIQGADEIQHMTTSINSLLELISLSQEQLKYRISLRTNELEKLSHLNKNLFKEISEQRSKENKLREEEKNLKRLAFYDTLTGLPNRTFFYELLRQAISHAEKASTKIAILFIDVDKFKAINDTYGHHFGDSLLKLIAGRIKQAIATTDVIAHLSGDEFILFLNHMKDIPMVEDKVQQLITSLNQPFEIDMVTINCTFSMGVSIYPDDNLNIEELYKQADLAMYYAKKRKGTLCWYFSKIKNSSTTSNKAEHDNKK